METVEQIQWWRSGPLAATALALLSLSIAPAVSAAEADPAPATEAVPVKAGGATAAPGEGGTAKRVVYLPESVKQSLLEQLKREVLDQAKAERWANPEEVPEWVKRVRFGGDLRMRLERDGFPSGNAVGQFPDFNAINNNGPTDDNGIDLSNDRYLNVNRPQTRPRLRARLGVDMDVSRDVVAGIRLGTGDQGAGVSSNQTLGGSGGFFAKYQFWLDRAFLRFGRGEGISVSLGRFENPLFTTDLDWSDNVSFDGLALRASLPGGPSFGTFLTAGAFPLYVTAFSYPAQSADKFGRFSKWLYAGQLGLDWRSGEAFGLKVAGAFEWFDNVQGHLDPSCDTNLKYVACRTDDSRPAYAQKGNTYRRLRAPSAAALAAEAASPSTPRYQYWGLASPFHDLVLTGRADLRVAPLVRLWLDAEWVRNMAFSAASIQKVAVNNCTAGSDGGCARFLGGGNGYLGRLTFGSATQERRWDWSAWFTYRYLESDAVVDAFTDADFGLGGTNLRGFVVGSSLVILDHITTAARWMSADQVVGPTYRSDVFQLEVNTRF